MTNVSDVQMRSYTKAEDFKTGDEVEFMDAGKWSEVDFSPAKDGSRIKKVFQLNIRMKDGLIREHTMNSSSLKSLREAWGEETSDWVGRKATASFIQQLSFGKLNNVLVLVPKA